MMIVVALVLYVLVCIFRLMHWHKRRHPKSVVPVSNSQVLIIYKNYKFKKLPDGSEPLRQWAVNAAAEC